MYCSLLRIQFTASTRIKPSQMVFDARQIFSTYLILAYLLVLLSYWMVIILTPYMKLNCTPAS